MVPGAVSGRAWTARDCIGQSRVNGKPSLSPKETRTDDEAMYSLIAISRKCLKLFTLRN
jgi:hypothetical protein